MLCGSLGHLLQRVPWPVFELILPYLKETLRHEQWPNREALFCVRAVADGCMDAVTPHLPEWFHI